MNSGGERKRDGGQTYHMHEDDGGFGDGTMTAAEMGMTEAVLLGIWEGIDP